MKTCLLCSKEYSCDQSWSKYCSHECSRKFNNKKHAALRKQRLKSDPDFKKYYYELENKRRRKKYANDPEYRAKRCHQVFIKHREKAGIHSDADLKKAKKGNGCLTKHGYRKITKKDHPNAWRSGEMFEHIFVMSQHLGRPIRKGETVHHKNGIKHDNRIDNLELWSSSHPYGQRVTDKISWCKEFLENYGHTVLLNNKDDYT